MGIPTVTLATRPFLNAARSAARGHSLPELPIVAIEHDYLFEDEATIRDRVAGVVLPLLAGLFRGSRLKARSAAAGTAREPAR